MDSTELNYPKVDANLMRDLFKESLKILKLKPWVTLHDSHTFVVVDPDTDEKHLVSVMGRSGEIFGVYLYLPEEGTKLYTKLSGSSGESCEMELEMLRKNRYITLSFEILDFVDEHDCDLEDDFAGKGWLEADFEDDQFSCETTAVFRQASPHCPPWHIDNESAMKLRDALVTLQVFMKSETVKKGPEDFIDGLSDEGYRGNLPTFRLKSNARRSLQGSWKFKTEEFVQGLANKPYNVPVDDLFSARVAKYETRNEVWQIGAIWLEQPALEDGVPKFVTNSMVVLESTGMVVGSQLHLGDKCLVTLLRKSLVSAIEELGYAPKKILVGNEIGYLAMTPLADSMVVEKVTFSEMLAFTAVVESLLEKFSSEDEGDLDSEDLALMEELQKDLLALSQSGEATEEALLTLMKKVEDRPNLQKSLEQFMTQEDEELTVTYVPPTSKERCIFRVDIKGIKPPIWRRIALPKDATFFDFHLAIQSAFGWEGQHFHQFEVKQGSRGLRTIIKWGELGDAFSLGMFRDEIKTKLSDVFIEGGYDKATYSYDFEDDWEHVIKFEGTKVFEDLEDGLRSSPVILKGNGPMMIEDCGGVYGFGEIIDGTHSELDEFSPKIIKELKKWHFDISAVQVRSAEEEIANLQSMEEELW